MPPKRKRHVEGGLDWFTQVLGKKLGKYYYKPGCISCGTKNSGRFHKFHWSELDRLQMTGLSFQFGFGFHSPYACDACRSRWYKAGYLEPTIVPNPEQDNAEHVNEDGDGHIVILTDFDEPEDVDAVVATTLQVPDLSPATIIEYQQALRDLVARPFEGNPFIDMDGFIAQYPRAYELKALIVGTSEQHPVLYQDRKKRSIIFSICYDGQALDRKCDYIKRYVGHQFITATHTDQRFLSRMNLCYHPSKSITRINDIIVTAQENVIQDIMENDPLLVVTIDDFHWCQTPQTHPE
ncbi:hypothetical protein DFS34DRAFT_683368, partial [Phlyctochytrium arcticum]